MDVHSTLSQNTASNDSQIQNHDTAVIEEGRLVTLLRKSLDNTAKKCFSAGRLSVFARHLTPLYKKHPNMLKNIHTQFMIQLDQSFKGELELMFEEENIVEVLNRLEKLITEAPTDLDHPAWRPTGEPDCDVQSHLAPIKIKQRDRLRRLLEDIEQHNKDLGASLQLQQQQLLDTQYTIENKTKLLNEVYEVCKNNE